MAKAYKLSVVVVETAGGVSALACENESRCGVGRGSTVDGAVGGAVRALDRGDTVARSEAKELLQRADDVWSEDFKRQALSGSRTGVAKKKRRR